MNLFTAQNYSRLQKAGDNARKRVSTYPDSKRAELENHGRAAIKAGAAAREVLNVPQTFDQWYTSEHTRIWSRRYLAHQAWHAALEQSKPAKKPRRKHLHIDHVKASVLETVTTFSPDGIGISEIAAQLDLSPTSVYRALRLLTEEGKVRKSVRRWII